jgi:hypothetical protein
MPLLTASEPATVGDPMSVQVHPAGQPLPLTGVLVLVVATVGVLVLVGTVGVLVAAGAFVAVGAGSVLPAATKVASCMSHGPLTAAVAWYVPAADTVSSSAMSASGSVITRVV